MDNTNENRKWIEECLGRILTYMSSIVLYFIIMCFFSVMSYSPIRQFSDINGALLLVFVESLSYLLYLETLFYSRKIQRYTKAGFILLAISPLLSITGMSIALYLFDYIDNFDLY